MVQIPEKLQQIADSIKADGQPRSETVRTILSWFNAQRRGYWVVSSIKDALQQLGLTTEPNFEHVYIGAVVEIRHEAEPDLTALTETDVPSDAQSMTDAEQAVIGGNIPDPVPRTGILASANRPPVSVSRDASVTEATTLMLLHNFSQLPVMSGDRNVYGAISWRSIGVQRSLGRDCQFVRECMEHVEIIPWEEPLFSVLSRITDRGYVLVSDREKRITGIVTTSDISDQFRLMSEPFLLLGEIENHIRRIIAHKYPIDVLQSVRDPEDESRLINAVSDLTFGEYIRLLENPKNWTLLNIPLDRARFVEQLEHVRDIRNDVMHFDPDAELQEDLKLLRDFVRFMQAI